MLKLRLTTRCNVAANTHNERMRMKNFLSFYFIVVLGYWFYLIYHYPDLYSKAYLFGKALTWPFQLLVSIF